MAITAVDFLFVHAKSSNHKGGSVYIYIYIHIFSSVGIYLEEYMVLNMKTGNGKVGRIEN